MMLPGYDVFETLPLLLRRRLMAQGPMPSPLPGANEQPEDELSAEVGQPGGDSLRDVIKQSLLQAAAAANTGAGGASPMHSSIGQGGGGGEPAFGGMPAHLALEDMRQQALGGTRDPMQA